MSADRLKASIDETGTTEDNNTSANLSNSSENMENANENIRNDAGTGDGINNPKANVSQQPQPNENTTNSTNDSESSLNEYNGDSVMTMARSANVINDSMVKHEPNSGDKIEPDANPVELIKKLEIVKEIRTKTANLEQIKSKLVEEFECIETESKCLQTFQSELDALIQEKMAHLEELRQIQNDITNMEYTIKQSDEEKKRAIESIVRLHLEYKPLKGELNHLREMIGLDKKCENEEIEMIESFLRKLQPFAAESKSNNNSNNNNNNNSNENKSVNSGSSSSRHGSSNSSHPPPLIVKSPNRVEQQQYHSASSSANSPMTHNSTNAKTTASSAAAKAKHEQELIDANTAALAQNIIAQRAAAAASMNPLLFSNPKAYIANMQNAPKTPFDLQAQLATMALMTQSLRPQSPLFNESQAPQHQHHHHHHHHQHEQFNKQFIPGGKSQKSELTGSNSTSNSNPQVNSNQAQPQPQSPQIQPQSTQLQNMQPTFRQQPPPMKSCLSCNQQIHRNAPICPLCKAKSRSVNPKKPKKKQPETNIANQQQQNSSSNASHQQMTPHKKGPGRHAADHLSNIKKELAH